MEKYVPLYNKTLLKPKLFIERITTQINIYLVLRMKLIIFIDLCILMYIDRLEIFHIYIYIYKIKYRSNFVIC
jgi:hypothetical protein